jgi:hypothetical protein
LAFYFAFLRLAYETLLAEIKSKGGMFNLIANTDDIIFINTRVEYPRIFLSYPAGYSKYIVGQLFDIIKNFQYIKISYR